jgi:hypothetical protein
MNAAGSAGSLVRLTSGSVRGRAEDGLAVFRGMPFAQPPVGELRLAAPLPVLPWEGVREAVAFGPPPPQSRMMGAPAVRGTDGDWLTVNVWSADHGAARLPVMVWIHGGGYVYGWSGDPLDGAALARNGSSSSPSTTACAPRASGTSPEHRPTAGSWTRSRRSSGSRTTSPPSAETPAGSPPSASPREPAASPR